MKQGSFSKTTDFLLPSGQPMISVQGKLLSASGRMIVTETATGNQLGHIRAQKSSLLHSRYFVENAAGMPILETANKISWKKTVDMTCPNVVAGGQPAQLTWKNQGTLHFYGDIMWQGTRVAHIEKNTKLFGTQYQLHIAPGFDPFLAVVMVMILDAQRKAEAAAASSGGGGGGG
jgi:uncharacterized protein YxjI